MMQKINIKNRMLQFVALITVSILLTLAYLVWMTHQTYFSHDIFSKELIPNVKLLNEVRSDILTLVSQVRECIRTEDIERRNRMVVDIKLQQQSLSAKLRQFSATVAHHPERHVLALATEQQYATLNHEISDLLSHHPDALAVPDVLTQFSPVFKAGKFTVMSIDASLALHLKHTEQAFIQIERAEISNIGIYLVLTVLLLGWIYLAGHKTYQRIIRVLGSEPEEFMPVVHSLLEGKQIPLNHIHPHSLVATLTQAILWDKETGVLNKLGFLQSFPQEVSHAEVVSAVLIKLHGLEELTDFIGIPTMQALLLQLVNRLQQSLPKGHLLARVSSTSFIWVIKQEMNEHELVKHVESQLAIIQEPYKVGIRQLRLKVFAGVIKTQNQLPHYQQIISYATLAACHAETKRQPFVFFSPLLLQASLDYVETETALSHAIENQELEIYLQPQVEISTRKVCGAEALLRWKRPEKGFIPPDTFIPIAERNGQILEIGNWVLDECIRLAVDINRHADTLMPVAINLSPHQIQGAHFFESLVSKLWAQQCEPAWIKLEITESVLLGNSDEVLNTLLQIAALGIVISLDDFGTGYSSLSYLTKYPISQIKIDRSFMSDIPLQLDSTELVKAIFHLADILHFEVVAEGIESLEQLNFLKQTTCKLVQGYYFFKPMPYTTFKAHVLVNPMPEELVT